MAVSSEHMYDAWTRLRITVAALEDMASRAKRWVDGVEAGELTVDEMWSDIRILTDQIDHMHDYLNLAQELVDDQKAALDRALGW